MVGSKLQTSQIFLINSLFIAFNIMLGLSWANRIRVSVQYQTELLEINPERLPVLGHWLMPVAVVFVTATALGRLKFMWDIRHPKVE